MDVTSRLKMPYLFVGQAAREATVNECLEALDTVVAAAIEEDARNVPPTTPAEGACYLVGAAPTGVWVGKAANLARYTANGWRFIAPVAGLTALIQGSGLTVQFRNGAWETGQVRAQSVYVGGQQVVGGRAAAIADPSGGAQVDAEARTAIGAILSALRAHGLIAV